MSGQYRLMAIVTTTDMYTKILEDLGLSPNEAKIYETLVEHGESGVGEISILAKIHRRNTYDSIKRLINKGLCFEVFSSGGNLYNAVDPGKLLELVSEKQQAVEKILPELNKKFKHNSVAEEAFIYRGYEGQKNVWRDILREGKDVMIIGAKAQWFDPKLDSTREAFYKETKRKKIIFHLLLDDEIRLKLPEFTKNYPGLMKYRYLPKESSTTAIIVIFGDYVVMYSGVGIMKMNDNVSFFIIHSKELVEGYVKWFNYMWGLSLEDKKK